jgi:BASS family bile acid:Na+ symporter
VLPVALAIIMFTLGLGLTLQDFKRVLVMPKGVAIGLVNLLLISPLLAFVLADVFNLSPVIAVALAALSLNLLAMTISFTISRFARLSDRQATAIALELGLHNATVAIAVAGMLDVDALMIPAAVYSAFMFITGGLFAKFMHSRNASSEAAA